VTSRLLSEVERPRLGDDHYKHTLIPQLPIMDPSDNLPRPGATSTISDNLAPPLTIESMVCLGDESAFVVRDRKGTVIVSFTREQVEFWPSAAAGGEGGWVVPWKAVSPEQRSLMEALKDEWRLCYPAVVPGTCWFQVEPLRPQCHHYKRTLIDFDGLVDGGGQATQVERVCTAQRGESGEYVSLNNTRVYACEHRTPRDFVSEERLRSFDKKVLGAAQQVTEEFDLDAAEASWGDAEKLLDEAEAAQNQGQDKEDG